MYLTKKSLLCLMLAFVLIFSILISLIVGIRSLTARNKENDIDRLISIVYALIEERDAANPLGADSRLQENLHLHPRFANAIFVRYGHYDALLSAHGLARRDAGAVLRYYHALEVGFDARFVLLDEMQSITSRAIGIQNRDKLVWEHSSAFSVWAGPSPGNHMFHLTFSDDVFLPLVDIILDFVGIPAYMLDVGESAVDEFWATEDTVTVLMVYTACAASTPS